MPLMFSVLLCAVLTIPGLNVHRDSADAGMCTSWAYNLADSHTMSSLTEAVRTHGTTL
jgi:hypothetical protein